MCYLLKIINFTYICKGYIYMNIKGAVTKQPLKSKKLLVDYMKSANNFFCISKQKGSRGTLFVGIIKL